MPRKKSTEIKDERVRNWTIIVYPESAPLHWRDILDEEHFTWIESPLHDKDINPDGENESEKKAHWHILLMFEGKKSYEQIKEISDRLNAPIPKKVVSCRGLVRYMIHLDNPEKYQYKQSEIIGHGGADIPDLLRPTSSYRYELIDEMLELIENNDVTEFWDMVKYAKNYRREDWFPLLCDNSAYIIDKSIKSKRHKKYHNTTQVHNDEYAEFSRYREERAKYASKVAREVAREVEKEKSKNKPKEQLLRNATIYEV